MACQVLFCILKSEGVAETEEHYEPEGKEEVLVSEELQEYYGGKWSNDVGKRTGVSEKADDIYICIVNLLEEICFAHYLNKTGSNSR